MLVQHDDKKSRKWSALVPGPQTQPSSANPHRRRLRQRYRYLNLIPNQCFATRFAPSYPSRCPPSYLPLPFSEGSAERGRCRAICAVMGKRRGGAYESTSVRRSHCDRCVMEDRNAID